MKILNASEIDFSKFEKDYPEHSKVIPAYAYADMVDVNDKMFLFNFVVGGTRDLETFRGGLDSAVGGVEAGEGVSDEA